MPEVDLRTLATPLTIGAFVLMAGKGLVMCFEWNHGLTSRMADSNINCNGGINMGSCSKQASKRTSAGVRQARVFLDRVFIPRAWTASRKVCSSTSSPRCMARALKAEIIALDAGHALIGEQPQSLLVALRSALGTAA